MTSLLSRRNLVVTAATLVLSASAHAATLTVSAATDDGSGTCSASKCTLRDAVLTAHSADQINFSLPVGSTIALTNGPIVIDKTLLIVGPGASSLTIARSSAAGTADFRVLDVSSGGAQVFISGLTISKGVDHSSDGGGGLHNVGELHLTSCVVSGNNSSSPGGGIANTGTLFVDSSTIANNSAGAGAGIYNTGSGSVLLTNSTVSGNSDFGSGGGILNYRGGALTITNSTISGNTGGVGGGIFIDTTAAITISNSTISGNDSPGANGEGGGFLITAGSTVTLGSTIVAENTAAIGPDFSSGGTVTSQGFNLIGNNQAVSITATTGDQIGTPAAPIDPLLGALQDNGGPTKTQAPLTGSKAIDKGDGGGLTMDQRGFTRPVDTPSISNAGDGSDVGAYEVQANQLTGCSEINLVVNNTTDADAGSLRSVIGSACGGSTITFAANVRGAITLTSGELLIDKGLIIKGPGANLLKVQRTFGTTAPFFRIFDISKANTNVAISGLMISGGSASSGGGIYSLAALALDAVTISENFATNGGGFYNRSDAVTITNSTFSGNSVSGTVSGSGGGIFNFGGQLHLTNCTLSGNSAVANNSNHDDSGGGIYTNVGSIVLISCTIAGNTGDLGGGMRDGNGGTVKSLSSIFALNTSATAPDFYGPLESLGFTLIGNNTLTTMNQGGYDQIGTPAAPVNPLLGPLQDNGGPTFTRALLVGSPAIDKGGSAGEGIDQRGFPRPSDDPNIPNPIPGDGSDIGAFEVQVPTPTPTPTPSPTPTPIPTATPTATPASQLLNLSTRKQVGAGDNVLIGGFIVVGTDGKKVLVRGLGPSLPVAGPLADPTLEIHAADTTVLAANNNWKDTQQAEISATGIPPASDLEAAIVTTLSAKAAAEGGDGYTAVLAGSGGGTGIGLLEIYDLNTAANSKLANISTRGSVGTGDDLLIGGFIPGPSDRSPLKVLLRALGPSLATQGVSDALQDPVLELHDGNGATLLVNDNWKDAANPAEIQATGIPPADDREAAIVTTLVPSNSGYTAVVRGGGDSTGVALVEVYALQ